jgi:hypothetical protein
MSSKLSCSYMAMSSLTYIPGFFCETCSTTHCHVTAAKFWAHFGTEEYVQFRQVFGLHRFKLHRHLVDETVKFVWFKAGCPIYWTLSKPKTCLIPDRLYSPIYWTLSKPKTCLKPDKLYSPIYWTLSKPKTCLKPDKLCSWIRKVLVH